MKKIAVLVLLCAVLSWCGGYEALAASYVKIQKVSEWGTSDYEIVKVHGNYVYCASSRDGVDIFNIREPVAPARIAVYNPPGSYVKGMEIEGNYLYIAAYDGVRIVDITNPQAPALVSYYTQDCHGLAKSGDYLYLLGESDVLQVLDVSNPYSPAPAGRLSGYRFSNRMKAVGNYLYFLSTEQDFLVVDVADPWNPMVIGSLANKYYNFFCISGDYAYASRAHGMAVIDISNPSSPQEKALYEPMIGSNYLHGQGITVKDNLVYMAYFSYDYAYSERGIEIIDISNPLAPTQAGRIGGDSFKEWPEWYNLDTTGNFLVVAGKGLRIYLVRTPGSPSLLSETTGMGSYNSAFAVYDNVAYIAKDSRGIYILQDSTHRSLELINIYSIDTVQDMVRSGPYLYVAGDYDRLLILDVSDPNFPQEVVELKTNNAIFKLYVKGQYLYALVQNYGLEIYDISNPASPNKAGSLELLKEKSPVWNGITVAGNYAYCGYTSSATPGFLVIDISNPAQPVKVGQGIGKGVYVKGTLLFAPGASHEDIIYVYDISNPAAPQEIAAVEVMNGGFMAFYGDYAYIDSSHYGFHVLDISNPTAITMKGSYSGPPLGRLLSKGEYLYALGESKLLVYKASLASQRPKLVLDRTDLYFGMDASGALSPPQKVGISNGGGGNLHWKATASEDFINARPQDSSTVNELYIGIDPTGLAPGTHKGTVILTDYVASNSPRTIDVTVTVYSGGQTQPPFGQFATPVSNTVVHGSIPVTGWVLDDIGVKSVKIYREEGDKLASIGEAVFVEGARPDVEAGYPGYPANYSAGWGYMMLTNFLPEGDDTYILHAIATDMEGNRTDLGTKTITVSNNTATEPFGAIDTPVQNGVTAGTNYTNFAWALTPQPKTIPTDGTTIHVYVDGQNQGNPYYNSKRSDIKSLFPGYNNSPAAGGYFFLNTMQFPNGIHTIQWVVKDDQGVQDGIGSRYFKISNNDDTYGVPGSCITCFAFELSVRDLERIPSDTVSPLIIKKGLEPDQGINRASPGIDGYYHVVIRELDNLEIGFAPGVRVNGGMVAGDRLLNLPPGSSFGECRNVFYWHAGPGFYGEYRLIFFQEDESGNISRKNVKVTIIPK